MHDIRWTREYADVGHCIELGAVFDDAIKSDQAFGDYAAMVATAILEAGGFEGIKAEWGKWGARLVKGECGTDDESKIEAAAEYIVRHPCWHALRLSTHVFTYNTKFER